MRAALGLGSNVGDREAHLRGAIEALRAHGEILAQSVFVETAPVGGPPQGPYVNAAVVLETALEPHALLAACQAIEAGAGRVRDVVWGPRTLDLDLLLCDDRLVDSDELVVPHPRLHERRFVLEPLAEIAPGWIVPRLGRSVGELLADLEVHS